MYGTKGGNAEERRYPTVSNVREEFYKTHEPCDDPDAGHVQLVGETLFRFDSWRSTSAIFIHFAFATPSIKNRMSLPSSLFPLHYLFNSLGDLNS